MGSKKRKTFSKVCPFFKPINEKLSLRPSPLRKYILNAVPSSFPCALPLRGESPFIPKFSSASKFGGACQSFQNDWNMFRRVKLWK
jgi:hypothetical protein